MFEFPNSIFAPRVQGSGQQGGQVIAPTWVNNAPQQVQYQQQYQPQQAATPVFDFVTRQLPVQQPQYDYQGGGGSSQGGFIPAPPQYRGGFDFGSGGVTGNGMINTRDNAEIMADLYQGQLNAYDQSARMGGRQDLNSRNSIAAQLQRWQQEAATGQSTMFHARPTFETPYEEYNETARLDTSRMQDLDSILSNRVGVDYEQQLGVNPGGRWRGLQPLSPVGSSFGGGNFAESVGGFDTGPQQAAPRPEFNATMGRVYNNGNLSSANDYGSYLTPLLRSGHNDHFAVANINGGGGGLPVYSDGFVPSELWNEPRGSSGANPSTPADAFRAANPRIYGDPLSPAQQALEDRLGLPVSQADLDNQQVTGWEPGARVFPGGMLPFGLDDAFPVQLQSTLKNAYDGFNIVDAGNPASLLPRNMALNAAKDAAFQMMTNRNMWRGDGGFHNIGNVLAQPWANRNMAPTQFGTAMRLFL